MDWHGGMHYQNNDLSGSLLVIRSNSIPHAAPTKSLGGFAFLSYFGLQPLQILMFPVWKQSPCRLHDTELNGRLQGVGGIGKLGDA